MKAVRNTLASTVAALCIPMMGFGLTSTAAQAEVTGNAGITNDYLWRGTSQNGHGAAISGGIDYGHSSGVYVGTWVSNASLFGGQEVDLYGGFAGEASGLSYDVGYITYNYPLASAADFAEIYVSLGYSIASVSYHNDMDNENSYVSVDLSKEVMGLTAGINFGTAMMKDSANDYMHYGVSISKPMGGDWDATFAVSTTDMDAGTDKNPVATFSMSKSFDLIK